MCNQPGTHQVLLRSLFLQINRKIEANDYSALFEHLRTCTKASCREANLMLGQILLQTILGKGDQRRS